MVGVHLTESFLQMKCPGGNWDCFFVLRVSRPHAFAPYFVPGALVIRLLRLDALALAPLVHVQMQRRVQFPLALHLVRSKVYSGG